MVTVKRIDVALLMESAMAESEWKGDKQACGVFFTDDKGYCLNKVLAIRIKQVEQAPEVFYSFWQPLDKVTTEYPYEDLKVQPKKHHLLSADSTTPKRDFDKMFLMSVIENELTFDVSDFISPITASLDTKRERDRSVTIIEIKMPNVINLIIAKEKKKEKQIFYTGEINILEMKSAIVEQVVKVNSATLYAVLKIFPDNSTVSFQFTHDRIKIIGASSNGSEIEIVLAQMK